MSEQQLYRVTYKVEVDVSEIYLAASAQQAARFARDSNTWHAPRTRSVFWPDDVPGAVVVTPVQEPGGSR